MDKALQAALLEKARRERARRVDLASVDMGSAQAKSLVEAGVPEQDVRSAIAKTPTYGNAPEGYFLDPNTGGMTSREGMKRNMPTGAVSAAGDGYLQGATFGLMDEAAGVVGRVQGGEAMANLRREQARARFEAQREAHPGAFIGGEVVGAVVSPAAKVAGPVKSVGGAALQGGAYASAYAAGNAEGDLAERGEQAAFAFPVGALFGAAGKKMIDVGSKGLQRLWGRAAEKPTLESLRAVKSRAYREVDASGEVFQPADLKATLNTVKAALDDVNYVPGVDKQTGAALHTLANASRKPVTIGQLDKIRQSLWKRYQASPSEVGILEAIDAIDDLVMTRGGTSELMNAARAANAKYKKAELLERAFRKAQDQTASTGSGGNILNKYRQAVTSIINDPKRAKWFTADEVDLMRNFVHGSASENILRRVGKLSPSGNGLMLALNLGAVAADPSAIAITAGATAAKASADRMAARGKDTILDAVSGYVRPANPMLPRRAPAAVGVLAEETRNYLSGI